MKKSFEDLYMNLIHNQSPEFMKAWQAAKQEQKKTFNLFLILAGLLDIFILVFFSKNFNNFSSCLFLIIPLLIIDTFIYVITSLIFSKGRKQFNIIFKKNIITKLLENFYDNLIYNFSMKMPSSIYNEASYERYDNYYSDDYLEASINSKYKMKMAEVKTEEEYTTTDSEGHTETHTRTLFHGLFAKIEMEKSIMSNLLIKPNHSIFKKHRLEMDSSEFEKLFDVSATNKIIGMQLLTHDVMDLLISFKNNTKIPFDITIYNNIMYLRFETGSMFELHSLKHGAFDEKTLKKYYDVLDFTYNLSTTLINLIEETEI